jgi:hypothetical protein
MFLRRGKSTEGWALIGFGVFACIVSGIGLSGGFGSSWVFLSALLPSSVAS